MRLDRLNLDKTDTSINSDQTQSVNFLNYKIQDTEWPTLGYHGEALSAAMAHPFVYSADSGSTHIIIAPMVYILETSYSREIHFYMGHFTYDPTAGQLVGCSPDTNVLTNCEKPPAIMDDWNY